MLTMGTACQPGALTMSPMRSRSAQSSAISTSGTSATDRTIWSWPGMTSKRAGTSSLQTGVAFSPIDRSASVRPNKPPIASASGAVWVMARIAPARRIRAAASTARCVCMELRELRELMELRRRRSESLVVQLVQQAQDVVSLFQRLVPLEGQLGDDAQLQTPAHLAAQVALGVLQPFHHLVPDGHALQRADADRRLAQRWRNLDGGDADHRQPRVFDASLEQLADQVLDSLGGALLSDNRRHARCIPLRLPKSPRLRKSG